MAALKILLRSALAFMVALPLAAAAQAPNRFAPSTSSFEIASIRADKSAVPGHANFLLGPGNVYSQNGGRFSAINLPVVDYIRFAYKLTDSETTLMQSTAPGWIATEHFDIEARSDNHSPTKDEMREMVKALLASRFNLKVHTEQREVPVIAMVLVHPGKLGPQLRPHPADGPPCSNLKPNPNGFSAPAANATIDGGYPALCGGLVTAGHGSVASHVRIGARDVPLRSLASNLTFDRPLVDQTGLQGNFDFVLEWGADPAIGSDAPTDRNAPGTTLEEALRDQLGIKLVRQKAPVEVLVVDHIDHPTDN